MTDIPNRARWVKVFQNLATDLKALVSLAAGSEIIVKQATATNLEALVTLKGLQGIIPNPITATRVDEVKGVAGVSTIDFPQVGEGKILFISSVWISCSLSAAAHATAFLNTKDAEDITLNTLIFVAFKVAGISSYTRNLFPAHKLVYGDRCFLEGSHANIYAYAGYSGWLEDV